VPRRPEGLYDSATGLSCNQRCPQHYHPATLGRETKGVLATVDRTTSDGIVPNPVIVDVDLGVSSNILASWSAQDPDNQGETFAAVEALGVLFHK
jgi:hypothetical protein